MATTSLSRQLSPEAIRIQIDGALLLADTFKNAEILLSQADGDLHGYAIMWQVEEQTGTPTAPWSGYFV
jgi:hypothetical protein